MACKNQCLRPPHAVQPAWLTARYPASPHQSSVGRYQLRSRKAGRFVCYAATGIDEFTAYAIHEVERVAGETRY